MTRPATPEHLRENVRALGWVATGESGLWLESGGPRGFRYGRAWSRAGAYESVSEPGSVLVVLPVEGTGVIVHDGVEIPYSPHQVVVLDGALESTMELHEPTARFLWRVDSAQFRALSSSALFGAALPVREGIWHTARVMTNSLIEAEPDVAMSVHLVRAASELLTGVLAVAAADADPRSPEEVAAAAAALIRVRQDDPSFTVTRLARELGASGATVDRAFAASDLTPSAVLDRERARRLSARLGDAERSEAEYSHLASTSGFATAADGRRAVARLLRGIAKRR